MLIPYRSEFDPEIQGEGSIDPLGLAALADRLADWIFPGMTARMWRPRFLTAMAATSVIVEPFEDELAKDGATPPWLIFEWYYVEAMTRLGDEERAAYTRDTQGTASRSRQSADEPQSISKDPESLWLSRSL